MRLILVVAVVAVLWAARAGVFYPTGSEWFEACWEKRSAITRAFVEPKAASAAQSLAWARCEPIALEGTYSAGLLFAGAFTPLWAKNDADTEALELAKACPGDSIAEWYVIVVARAERRGGPSVFDQFLPATYFVRRVVREAWPDCSKVRERWGYPRVVSKGSGWAMEDPCVPCDRRAREASEAR